MRKLFRNCSALSKSMRNCANTMPRPRMIILCITAIIYLLLLSMDVSCLILNTVARLIKKYSGKRTTTVYLYE